jgi:serine/threonine protein kinase
MPLHVKTTLWYRPPEFSTIKKTTTTDIWCFGLVLLDLALGQEPHSYIRKQVGCETSLPICAFGMKFIESASPIEDADLWNLIQQCLKEEPDERPTINGILEHEFFKKI